MFPRNEGLLQEAHLVPDWCRFAIAHQFSTEWVFMLSINEIRKLIDDEKMADQEVGQIRDQLYNWAELILDVWENQDRTDRAKDNAIEDQNK